MKGNQSRNQHTHTHNTESTRKGHHTSVKMQKAHVHIISRYTNELLNHSDNKCQNRFPSSHSPINQYDSVKMNNFIQLHMFNLSVINVLRLLHARFIEVRRINRGELFLKVVHCIQGDVTFIIHTLFQVYVHL